MNSPHLFQLARALSAIAAFACISSFPLYAQVGGDSELLYQWGGTSAGDWFGSTMSSGGDINADGINDVIIGAGRDNIGSLSQAGSVSVYSGQGGNLLHYISGGRDHGWFGYSVSNAGDTNGDGFDDILVGEPGSTFASNFLGAAYVISGRNGTLLFQVFSPSSSVEFGKVVSGAGDLNGDGFADFLVKSGGRNHTGSVVAYSGADASVLYRWLGSGWGWGDIGNSMAAAGDVNRDGFDDVLISAQIMDYHFSLGEANKQMISLGLPLLELAMSTEMVGSMSSSGRDSLALEVSFKRALRLCSLVQRAH